jgi:iron complex outermembrane receptor protein
MRRNGLLLAASGLCAIGAPALAQTDMGHDLSEVVITASPLKGDPDRFATIVEQIDHDQVLSNGGASLADALRNVPGVSGTGFAAGASRPVIRGMDAQRVKVTENGLSSSDVSDVGPDHGVPIDPLAAQSIEVVRGAATLRYGSQAIGGVVNVINNRIPTKRTQGVTGEATSAYDSVSDTGEGTVMIDAGQGSVAAHLDAFARRASDYAIPGGTQPNSFFRGNGYSGGASVFLGDSRIGADATHYQAQYGIPSDDTFIRMRQNKGAFGSSFDLGQGALKTLNLDVGYADYSHSEIDPETAEVLSTFNNKEWDGRAELVFGPVGPFSASALGVQLQDRKFAALGEGADYLLPTHTQNAAAFAFVEAPLGPVNMQAAVRIEHARTDGTPPSGAATSRSFTPVSASVGFTYDATGRLRLGLTAASAARAPAQTELFARGPHDGPATFETGDAALRIERANSLEATLRYRLSGKGRIEASVWGARFDNYIYGALTGRLCDEGGDCAVPDGELKELNYAQQDATFWGAELKAFLPLATLAGGDLSAQVLGDYVRAKFAGGRGDVPRIQPGRLGGGLHWENDQIDASFLVLQVGAQNHVGVADSATDSYASVDAQLGWRPFRDSRPGLEIMVVGHNLANETIRNAAALNKDAVVMPGRDLRVVLRTRF